MKKYLITYDLHNRRDYARLYFLLRNWRAVRLTESNWLVVLQGGASSIRDLVRAEVDADDTVAVLEITAGADWATKNVDAPAVNWLSNQVTVAA